MMASLDGWQWLFVGLLALAGFFWLWMLVDCLIYERGINRVLWFLGLLFSSIPGGLSYYLWRKMERDRKRATPAFHTKVRFRFRNPDGE